MSIQFEIGTCVLHIVLFCFQIALVTAFEIRLGTRQLPKIFPREICISSNVRRQIIAEAKLSTFMSILNKLLLKVKKIFYLFL